MQPMYSSEVRKEWSAVLDRVIREKPVFIQRTRDRAVLCSAETLWRLAEAQPLVADCFTEADGTITLSLRGVDLAANGETLPAARAALARDLQEYAEEYYREFALYSRAPNRRDHLPYVLLALAAPSARALEEAIVCQNGTN